MTVMEYILLVHVVLCSYVTQDYVQGSAFTSIANLKHMYASEYQIKEAVQGYIQAEERRIAELKRTLQTTLPTTSSAEAEVESLDHPVNAYHLLQKWSHVIKRTTDEHNKQDLHDRISNLNLNLPSEDDERGALKALARLHRVYNLSTSDLAQGRVLDHTGEPLTSEQLLELALVARDVNQYKLAEECLNIIRDRNDTTANEADDVITITLAQVYGRVGDYEEALRVLKPLYLQDKHNSSVRAVYRSFKQKNETMYLRRAGVPIATTATYRTHDADWLTNYEALCRGDKLYRDPAIVSSLVCRYTRTVIPYAPIKEEILNWDPRISLLYDAITPHQSQYLMDQAQPSLSRSRVGDAVGNVESDTRISEVAWIWDHHDPMARYLTDKVSIFTGLNTTYDKLLSASEPFQVVNYGMGGQYEPHIDYYEDDETRKKLPEFIRNTGDRIATFMYYLKEPIEGGGTVFPELNITIPATQNGAAFWYNMNRAGVYDIRTRHAGCPVLLGEKWVANKWIRDLAQTFTRPCGLTPDALDL